MRTLIDRTGRFRLIEDRETLPVRWQVSTTKSKLFKKRWQSLDRVLHPNLADPFSAGADTLWTERSFPLAFDADPNVLFYASNVGRNTYGIFGVNLSTGEPTGLATIDRKIDLADPATTLISPPPRRSGKAPPELQCSHALHRFPSRPGSVTAYL